MVKLTGKDRIKEDIRHNKVVLGFTERLIKDPPTDSLSIDMTRQAARIKAEIAELEEKLKNLNKKGKGRK